MNLNETEMEKFRAGWKKMELDRNRKNALLRKKALSEVEHISGILSEKYGVRKIILFGSLLDEDRFGERSDIDIAVEGLDESAYFKALGKILMASSFSVDLVPIEDASELLLKRLEKGKVVYERGQST
ncbi:MAG: nucleotidyltransferase family protein [Chitinispirillaceae bacterium]